MSNGLGSLWYARHQVPGEPGWVVVGVASAEFADGTVVELPPPVRRPTGWVAEVHLAGPGRVPHRVLIADAAIPGAPLLWYVVLPAPGTASEVDLVAFSTADRAEGDVLDAAAFQALGLDLSNQVGAMRWDTATGLVRQVYVAPAVRRRGVATKVGWAVACIVKGRGWAPLQADGRRTDLGEAWVSARSEGWRVHVPERTDWAPPMTPPAEAPGIPLRNLEPDPVPRDLLPDPR
jgi:GNAT superfamily N-acetyltransferase